MENVAIGEKLSTLGASSPRPSSSPRVIAESTGTGS